MHNVSKTPGIGDEDNESRFPFLEPVKRARRWKPNGGFPYGLIYSWREPGGRRDYEELATSTKAITARCGSNRKTKNARGHGGRPQFLGAEGTWRQELVTGSGG